MCVDALTSEQPVSRMILFTMSIGAGRGKHKRSDTAEMGNNLRPGPAPPSPNRLENDESEEAPNDQLVGGFDVAFT